MRIRSLVFAAGAALVFATPTLAQSFGGLDGLGIQGQSWMYRPSTAPPIAVHRLTLQQRYDIRVMALKAKLQALTAQDGGQLSLAHQTTLQQELDGVNHWFKLKPSHG
ncbi:hypothetical protein [Phenylobacterium sp.]|uniref:hypothetical protein n=1 Tax=Phenylobacterium sp. TaxID=1871053 RepID=UPI002CF45831|nr:hypothetical protein [Phenylobacterium sp.]HLZ73887.1 hypothetical protein [Phenylobacterium sp.]